VGADNGCHSYSRRQGGKVLELQDRAELYHGRLQFKGVEKVDLEKNFLVSINAESESAALDIGRKMARELLSNIVMENFDVSLRS
jgi:phosphoribosylformylglycinamidine (FGAM) synthase PurS component